MAHHNSVVKLDDLKIEVRRILEVVLLADFVDGVKEVSILLDGSFNSREQIFNDVLKEGNIVDQEFGHVDIPEGSQEELLLVHVRVLILEKTGCVNNRSDGTHSIIVVILG